MHIDTSTAQAQWFNRYSAAQMRVPGGVLYSEASYFDGYHFAHIAAWEDAQRIARGRRNFVRNMRSNRR